MTATRSLGYVVLVSILALALGGLLWMAFDELLIEIFSMPGWDDPLGAEADSDVAEDVAAGQRSLELIWGVVPVIIVVAVAFNVLAKSRRTR